MTHGENLTPFGKLLSQYRREAGLSRPALARRAGVSAAGIKRLECGERRQPQAPTVYRLAAGLELDAHKLAAFVDAGIGPLVLNGTMANANES